MADTIIKFHHVRSYVLLHVIGMFTIVFLQMTNALSVFCPPFLCARQQRDKEFWRNQLENFFTKHMVSYQKKQSASIHNSTACTPRCYSNYNKTYSCSNIAIVNVTLVTVLATNFSGDPSCLTTSILSIELHNHFKYCAVSIL